MMIMSSIKEYYSNSSSSSTSSFVVEMMLGGLKMNFVDANSLAVEDDDSILSMTKVSTQVDDYYSLIIRSYYYYSRSHSTRTIAIETTTNDDVDVEFVVKFPVERIRVIIYFRFPNGRLSFLNR